ncbi:MAG: AMP-binding protein [Burkholderiaceae bacterium]|nr:AMP-binding protein [Burkholderiaceae bacterium]
MKPTILFEGRTLEAEPYFERVMRAATALQRLGVTPADTVALMMRNSPTVLELMLACRWLGATWCPINWHFRHDELRFILGDCGARLFIADAPLLQELHGAVPDGMTAIQAGGDSGPGPTADDSGPWPRWEHLRDAAPPCAEPQRTPRGPMLYTSGTTGRPKGIRRNAATPEQVQRTVEKSRLCYGIEPGMRALLNAPMYHSAPNAYAVGVSTVEDSTLLLEQRFDAERTLQLIEQHRLTHAYLVPTLYVRLLRLPDAVKRKYDVSSMRHVASTGSACPPEVKRAMIDWWGPVFTEAYGSSELGYMTYVTSAEAHARPGTAGRPTPGAEIRILDEQGRELPPGEPGLIYVRQPGFVDFTYQGNDGARREMERDGFLTMADVGYLDRDGYLFIVDRSADMVISGGVNIYPAEIEQVLIDMPGVQDCAVFGIPHDEYGEALAAAVQPRAGTALQADAVQAYVRERLAGYKVPAVVTFHAELPREDTGKIFKRRLREPYWAGRSRRV